MDKKVELYLKKFAENAKSHFENKIVEEVLKKYDIFFNQTFFKQGYIENMDWENVKELGNNLHSFNALPLARTRAINQENNEIDNLRKAFIYLTKNFETSDIKNEIQDRLKNILSNNGRYKIKFWGISAISEIIGQKFPKEFVFYNHRDREAIKFLEIEIPEKKNEKGIWHKFIKYQNAIAHVIELYKQIVLPVYDAKYPIGIQINQFFSWIYINYISSKNYTTVLEPIELESFIDSISISNYFSIQNIELTNLKSNEIYLLGENGTGKTILLQAIFLALKGNFIKEQEPSEISEILDALKANPKLELKVNITDDFAISNSKDDNSYIPNIFAYGTNRNNQNKRLLSSFDFLTLFSQNYKLTHLVDWLTKIYYKENVSKINSGIKLVDAIKLLEDLLHENVRINVKTGVENTEVTFIEKDTPITFEQLADGYRSVLIWVIDMTSRLFDIPQNSNVHSTKDLNGIVLIDELDLFLHPKWSLEIVKKIRNWFPKIQFIISTHSPILMLGASEDAVFYKLYKENGKTQISEQWTTQDISQLMANGIITSPLFDLPSAKMSSYSSEKELDTNTSFWYSKIDEKIKQEISSQNKIGKEYFTKEEITELTQWAIDEISKEVKND